MFQMSESSRGVQIRMSATLEAIEQADEQVCSWLNNRCVPVDLFAMRLLIHEALLNAVTHGSGINADRTVLLQLELGDTDLRLDVEDSGPGFVWDRRPAMNDLAGSGRGLAVMREYSDGMGFNKCGNRITLRKNYAGGESWAGTPEATRRR